MSEMNMALAVVNGDKGDFKIEVDLGDEDFDKLPEDFGERLILLLSKKVEITEVTAMLLCSVCGTENTTKEELFEALIGICEATDPTLIEVSIEEVLSCESN